MFVSQAHQCTLILSFFCIFITVNAGDSEIVPDEFTDTPLVTTVINVEGPLTVNSGDSAFFNCTTKPSARQIWWSFDNYNITKDLERYDVKYYPNDGQEIERSVLHIRNIDLNDEGNFTCHIIAFDDQHLSSYAPLNITVLAEVVDKKKTVRLKIDGHDELFCEFKGLPMSNFYWTKDNNNDSIARLKNNTQIKVLNETNVNMTLSVSATNRKDNGTYYCIARGLQGEISDSVKLLVLDKPKIRIDFVKAVGAEKIYVNWTVDDGNSPVKEYRVQFMENGKEAWQYYPEKIGGGNNSYVLKDFRKDSEYKLRITAINGEGEGHYDESKYIRTLLSDPDFIPKIQVTGVTFNSITIGWNSPSPELEDHVHYYQLFAQAANSKSNKEAIYPAESRNWYLFDNFESATEYNIKVRACSEYTKQCSAYSEIASGTTSDGVSGPPKNVSVECRFDNISRTSFVYVEWEPPTNPNGKIVTYQVTLGGTANFKNEEGVFEKFSFGIKIKSVDEKSSRTRFDGVPANTNYTVNVSGITRLRKVGLPTIKNCTMPPTTPEKIKKFSWIKHEENGRYIFKLTIPRISERNGAICCYRVFMVRLGSQKGLDKLRPEDIVMQSYQQVHNSSLGGAYVAEMFTSDDQLSAVFLGDGYVINSTNSACLHCIGLRPKPEQTTDILDTDDKQQNWPEQKLANIPSLMTTATPVPNFTTSSPFTDVTTVTDPAVTSHIRVRRDSTRTLMKPLESDADKVDPSIPYDGFLDTNSNYTGFVEIIVYGANPGETLAAYTDCFEMQRPAPPDANMYLDEQESGTDRALNLVAHTLCALVVAALILLAALCLLHRYTKQVARAQGVEMITFRNSFRHLCRSFRGRHQLVSSHPPDMTPISKEDLFDAYVERHRDSDYGFQQEFEQLPDRFADRTTRASDARENIYKNRYPDIKAYDQTRVKLSQIDSIAGSDYINANVVLGYKERKKFICAQGPMDNTVCDYWRMIWEQRLELILMLTNLEEYSKTKCAKYWPDKAEGDKVFGDISVMHVDEKRYSDYIIRELKVSRTMVGRDREERYITQYHFLVWKDFMAPEHPHGILKFIKRMNEAYSLERGPILVHCSAGVGRTGTLVALDSLLQQLNEEGQVSVFNTICDLRHQRNFLVQSLKQYIFVYRALMEVAQYGDTEIPANKLKLTIEELKKVDNKDKCKMEEDYEKIKSVLEDRKPFSVGGGEENRCKNRSELVIPYDRNRVILTPIPGREHSTYINASFIEGYDNSESFIITQDPLEGTIPDFWRMISEQNISVIIMLSDLGDSPKKCPRYWPDDEMCYDHIRVKYIQSESCPYYTRRELSVTNKKSEETVMVTQMQYHGWPTVEGEVPEVTRGLIELADQAQTLQTAAGHSCTTTAPPIVVHCNCGSDRSSMFVGLCILIQQLRTEKRVDIFTTTRKLRSQRNCMLNTFAQYEFLHRAIVNYADLHHLCEDET